MASEDESLSETSEETTDESVQLSDGAKRFLLLLEERMIKGHSDSSNRTWATLEVGVPMKTYERLKALILRSWRLEATTIAELNTERDRQRQRYLFVYNMAVEKERLSDALRALERLDKLDGLEKPSGGDININIGGAITNSARDQVAKLVDKMRSLAERGVPKVIPVLQAGNGTKSGSNGHGSAMDDDSDQESD